MFVVPILEAVLFSICQPRAGFVDGLLDIIGCIAHPCQVLANHPVGPDNKVCTAIARPELNK
jgi:hypothetical protein